MKPTELIKVEQQLMNEFESDTKIIGEQTEKFLRLVYPSYLLNPNSLESSLDNDSTLQLDSMTFFRIACCSIDTVDKVFEEVNAKIEKLLTALHSIDVSVSFGLISRDGITNLVLGIYSSKDVESAKSITQGMLLGVEMEGFTPDFEGYKRTSMSYGILSGVPSLYVKEQKQTFSLSSIMRSLNGRDYTVLFIAKPVRSDAVMQNISDLIAVKDAAFAVSKRNVSRAKSYAETTAYSKNISDGTTRNPGQALAGVGAAAGAIIGTYISPGTGTMAGAAIGGGLGSAIGSVIGAGKTHTEGYSVSISKAITDGQTISGDIQNGFALELMNYADKAIERFKIGQNNGIWQTAIAYSAESEISRNIIKACLSGELSRSDPDKLPLLAFEPRDRSSEPLAIPKFLGDDDVLNPLCSYISSAELGLLCTVPTESVPDFELRIKKSYPLVRTISGKYDVVIGNIADGKQKLDNMPFSLTYSELNKHTFICGITGSGKTTTVKKILKETGKPFLVIESAKKEYRYMNVETTVFTLGKPEINCPQMNPFYIMQGVSPQTHIDYLKDLFNASFSFYGPMPYILEKCLHTIYANKGWNLTLGFHPMLSNSKSETDFFDIEYAKGKYSLESHKYLFPTMQELKDEIARYIEEDLKYGGEIAGNVKTAMKVRLENLCIGAKGFTFNTSEYLDFSKLLEKNVVFELEGLADDSDKAFSVGLLVIFINEYRNIAKEISRSKKVELKHLLVIEEAHRLLKNIDTEKTNEAMGNPKGKAVEHFTNMIAEMRSYGQGVIVAEQIPTKLAPDVIKNTSNKIVQRIVSADDQQIIANTIGISTDEALQLGTLETGYAYCHKEGMSLPATVKIFEKYFGENKEECALDVDYVSDGELSGKNENRFKHSNLSATRSNLGDEDITKLTALALLNTIFTEKAEHVTMSCKDAVNKLKIKLNQKGVELVCCNDKNELITEYLAEVLLSLLVRGVYCVPSLPKKEFVSDLKEMIYLQTIELTHTVKQELEKLYGKPLADVAKRNVSELIKRSVDESLQKTPKEMIDISKTIRGYFLYISAETTNEIATMVKGDKAL